mgnify:CR=1 FL=1
MQLSELIKKDPVIERVAKAEEVIWFNPGLRCRDAACLSGGLSSAKIGKTRHMTNFLTIFAFTRVFGCLRIFRKQPLRSLPPPAAIHYILEKILVCPRKSLSLRADFGNKTITI